MKNMGKVELLTGKWEGMGGEEGIVKKYRKIKIMYKIDFTLGERNCSFQNDKIAQR